jgi:hypothetical protein
MFSHCSSRVGIDRSYLAEVETGKIEVCLQKRVCLFSLTEETLFALECRVPRPRAKRLMCARKPSHPNSVYYLVRGALLSGSTSYPPTICPWFCRPLDCQLIYRAENSLQRTDGVAHFGRIATVGSSVRCARRDVLVMA